MKTDEGSYSVRREQRASQRQHSCQLLELGIHRDAQGLKGARRRIDAADSTRTNGAHDSTSQIERVIELFCLERLLDAASDTSRGAFFTKLEDDIGKLILRQSFDEITCRLTACRVHAHVERAAQT